MRFTIRSLSGKLIISGALTLLLCLLLFGATSWYLLKSFYEHEARSDATTHLTLIQRSYQAHTALLIHELVEVTHKPTLAQALEHPTTSSSLDAARTALLAVPIPDGYSALMLISSQQHILVDLPQTASAPPYQLPPALQPLVQAGLLGKTLTMLVPSTNSGAETQDETNGTTYALAVVVPVLSAQGKPTGVVIGEQSINDVFAINLLSASENSGLNLLLCQGQHILGRTIQAFDHRVNATYLCSPQVSHLIDIGSHWFTLSDFARAAQQASSSPPLLIVDIEPLYSLNAHGERALELLIGLGAFIIALGVSAYTLIARRFFIRPLRRLQARVASLVAQTNTAQDTDVRLDELSMLARSFNLLSASLTTQASESNDISNHMSDLLMLSDILISTLNLEDLLREIVSRLGVMMEANCVSLLLYGRDMLTPWAVAQWMNTQQPGGSLPTAPGKQGAVTVHTDPAGDITMAATTKMAAMPSMSQRQNGVSPGASGPRRAIRAPKLAPPQQDQRRLGQLHSSRPALRELDMLMAHLAIQRQKITYAEDIQAVYRERQETWASLASEAGYHSVIAVPMFVQDSAIGAIMLYSDKPHTVTGRDTFLLSTAAVQAAMAIQNALLFSEVKNKNAALEHVNQLKSQFLATVTHELRTPLHSIISYGSLLTDGYVDGELTAEQQEHIAFIVRRAEDLSQMVGDMLDLSKIEADQMEVKIEPLDLAESLRDVVNELKQIATNRGLYLNLAIEPDLPMAQADSHRLRQIVINLASNALKFTEKGGVTIHCNLLERYDMLRISVTDTGIGISPAALDYIFEAFRQADGSTTRRFGGTGLGLTIARKLIERQGGEVSVESMFGQGSTFSFTLPIAPTPRARATVSRRDERRDA